MTHKYNLGDEVILHGRFDGKDFKDDVCTIVALRSHPTYKYIVKVHDRKGRVFHEGHIDTEDDTGLIGFLKEHYTVGHLGLFFSNSGGDRYSVDESIITGLNNKHYDPSQQPFDDGDI